MLTDAQKATIENLSTEEMLHEINLGRSSRFQREKFAYLKTCYQLRISTNENQNHKEEHALEKSNVGSKDTWYKIYSKKIIKWCQQHKDQILIAIIGGVIVLVIGNLLFGPVSTSTTSGDISKPSSPISAAEKKTTSIITKETNAFNNKYLVQSYSTIEVFNGDLSVTLNSLVEFSNQNIDITVSRVGSPQKKYVGLALGEKFNYENYELSFVNTQKNIQTYDVLLKIEAVGE